MVQIKYQVNSNSHDGDTWWYAWTDVVEVRFGLECRAGGVDGRRVFHSEGCCEDTRWNWNGGSGFG